MPVATNTVQTYSGTTVQQIVNREDLSDTIRKLAPLDTIVQTMAGKETIDGIKHEWIYKNILNTTKHAGVVDGDQATYSAAITGTRVCNYTMIARAVPNVSDTEASVSKAGGELSLAKQIADQSLAAKQKLECNLLQNDAFNQGSVSVARVLAGLESWLVTNTSHGSGGSTPGWTSATSMTAPTDGTARALDISMLNTAVQGCWTAGSNPTMLVCNGNIKTRFGVLAAGSTVPGKLQINVNPKGQGVLSTGVDVWSSDFGPIMIKPSRYVRTAAGPLTCAFLIDWDYLHIGYLRDWGKEPLAYTGGARAVLVECEATLIVDNEKAHAKIADLNHS